MQRHWLLALALSGCAVDSTYDDLDQDATAATTEVARVTAADGTVWRFLEADPGSLFVWATARNSQGRLDDPDPEHQLTSVQLYQRLTTAPVPQALIAAQARAHAVADETGPDQSGLKNEASDPGRPTAQVSADYFEDHYCPNNWDFLYCWPSFYGSPYVQRKGYYMEGYVSAVSNTIDFRFRYKKHSYSGWTTLVSAQAFAGEVHTVHQYHWYRRWRRWEVLDNGANNVRYSNVGMD
jgi:hypothetical protein